MSQIDAAARQVIEQAGFGKRFTHGLGHGFGLDVNESIRLARGQDRELQSGMVVTIEPGIYIRVGAACESKMILLVTRSGSRVLSYAARELDANRVDLL